MIELYSDQIALLDKTRQAMSRHRAVLMQAATGFGKTVCTASMFATAIGKERRCLFIVPRREILRQASNTLHDFSIPHSFIAAGYEYDPNSYMHVATVETLTRRLDKAPDKDLVVIDETHHGSAGLDRIVKRYKSSGSYLIGLSATPTRLDGRGLGCWYDEMACGESVSWLIQNGRLSQYRLFAPDRPDLSGIATVAGDYARGQLADRLEHDTYLVGHAVDTYYRHAIGRLNVTFCASRKHSAITNQKFRDAGIPSACVDGETPDDERSRIFKAFAKRELLNVCNVDLLTFGFDLSSAAGMDVTVESMSDLRPTKSLALQMQKYGRVLRKKDFPALIFDHSNNAEQHGLPDDDRDWSLADQVREKRDSTEKPISIRQCPKCDRCHRPAPACPECGHVYVITSREIKEVEGELKEVSAEEMKRRTEERKAENRSAKTLDDLIQLGYRRGYKSPEAWAAKMYSLRGLNPRFAKRSKGT